MANKTFQGRIVQKHDTEANWKKATNFVPLKGEIIVYDDLNKIKIGDGTTKVGDLAFTNNLPIATKDVLGGIKKGNNINIAADGTISVNDASTGQRGVTYLVDSYTRTDTDKAVTPKALNSVYKMLDGYANKTYVDEQIAANIPSTEGLATETYVNTKVAGIVNSAPETLDTLQELASALGNDPNFATTVATEIGKKANSADLATVAKTGNYSDLINKRTVNGSTNNIETNFYVNFTQKSTTGLESFQYTADKTIEEIKNAYNHGYNIVGKIANASSMGDLNLPLAIINPTENMFCFMGFGDTSGENAGRGIGLYYILYDNGSWSGVGCTLAFYDDLPDLATVATSGSYNDLLDTPTIPSVGNGTLTIQKNGTSAGTFTANATTDKTINITVPTKVSELTDDVVKGKYLSLTGGTMTGNININNKTITNLKTPTADTEAANKKYVDDQIAANSSSTTIITWSDDGT